jgi:hypothetical protein
VFICYRQGSGSEDFGDVDEGGLGETGAFVEVADGGVEHGEEVVEFGNGGVVLAEPVGKFVELDFEELISFLHLIGLYQPLYREKCCFSPIITNRLLIHKLINIQLLILVLRSIRNEVGNKGLQLFNKRTIVFGQVSRPVPQVEDGRELFVALQS